MANGLSTVYICDAVSPQLWLVTGHEIAKSCIAFSLLYMTNTLKKIQNWSNSEAFQNFWEQQ